VLTNHLLVNLVASCRNRRHLPTSAHAESAGVWGGIGATLRHVEPPSRFRPCPRLLQQRGGVCFTAQV
jgi:hypothetical protein